MKRMALLLCIIVISGYLIVPHLCMGQPKYGGTLVYGMPDDVTSVDPHRTGQNALMWRICLVGNNLVESDSNYEYRPALATSWDTSADGKKWTFHLQKEVKFHNGREITAEDIKWNFERMMGPKSYFKGQLAVIESIKVIDRYTIQLIMKRPCMQFLAILAGACSQPWFLAPESATKDGVITHPIGTGPFEFVEWKPADHFRVKKFNDYWEKGKPYLDGVVVKSIPDKTALLAALRTGEVHIAVRLPIEQVLLLEKKLQKDFRFEYNLDASAQIMFNLSKPPFNDVRVRRAIAYSINKKELLDGIYYGHGEESNQFFGKRSPWYCEGFDNVQNREKAKALLAEAGYPNGLDVTIKGTRHYPYMGKSCEILQQQLKEIGINVKVELLDVATLLGNIFKGNFTFTVGGFPEYGDPDFFYRNYFTPNGHLAFFHGKVYNNPQVTAWLEEATQVPDLNGRKELYCKVVKTVNEDYPAIFTTRGETATGISNKVKGFKSHVARLDRYAGGGLHYTWLEK